MFAWENCFYLLCLTFEESNEFTCTAIKKGFYQNVGVVAKHELGVYIIMIFDRPNVRYSSLT